MPCLLLEKCILELVLHYRANMVKVAVNELLYNTTQYSNFAVVKSSISS
jgi:hypothetical protein